MNMSMGTTCSVVLCCVFTATMNLLKVYSSIVTVITVLVSIHLTGDDYPNSLSSLYLKTLDKNHSIS